jgi:hypothetical protein
MIKLNREETMRLEELKLIVWSYVARETLGRGKTPYEIFVDSIEKNKGRIGKALRLLEGYVTYKRLHSNNHNGYTWTTKIYAVDRMEESEYLGKAPVFTSDLPHIHDELFTGEYQHQYGVDTVVFQEIRSLTKEELIYVYWHKDEYLFTEYKKETKIYPKALLDVRMKAIMRAIIEQYFHSNFHSRVEEYLSVPTGSVKHDDHFDVSIRNFAAHGHRFTMDKYFGTNGFLEEYTHYRDYFEALIKSLNTFNTIIDNTGGHAAIVEKYRKDIISTLLKKAPLCAFQPYTSKGYGVDITMDDKFNNPFFNAFILRNSEYMNYDLLYGDNKDILFINEDDCCTVSMRQVNNITGDTIFTPKQDELDLIKGAK